MKRHYQILLSLLASTLVATMLPPQARAAADPIGLYGMKSMMVYLNDGRCAGFLDVEVDSVTFSRVDSQGVEHYRYVTQCFHTRDSVYRYAIADIDSVRMLPAERVYNPRVKPLDSELLPYFRAYDDSQRIITFKLSTPQSLLPQVGDIVYAPYFTEGLPCGFAGEVTQVKRTDAGYKAVCDAPVEELTDVFSRLQVVAQLAQVTDADGNPQEVVLTSSPAPEGYQPDAQATALRSRLLQRHNARANSSQGRPLSPKADLSEDGKLTPVAGDYDDFVEIFTYNPSTHGAFTIDPTLIYEVTWDPCFINPAFDLSLKLEYQSKLECDLELFQSKTRNFFKITQGTRVTYGIEAKVDVNFGVLPPDYDRKSGYKDKKIDIIKSTSDACEYTFQKDYSIGAIPMVLTLHPAQFQFQLTNYANFNFTLPSQTSTVSSTIQYVNGELTYSHNDPAKESDSSFKGTFQGEISGNINFNWKPQMNLYIFNEDMVVINYDMLLGSHIYGDLLYPVNGMTDMGLNWYSKYNGSSIGFSLVDLSLSSKLTFLGNSHSHTFYDDSNFNYGSKYALPTIQESGWTLNSSLYDKATTKGQVELTGTLLHRELPSSLVKNVKLVLFDQTNTRVTPVSDYWDNFRNGRSQAISRRFQVQRGTAYTAYAAIQFGTGEEALIGSPFAFTPGYTVSMGTPQLISNTSASVPFIINGWDENLADAKVCLAYSKETELPDYLAYPACTTNSLVSSTTYDISKLGSSDNGDSRTFPLPLNGLDNDCTYYIYASLILDVRCPKIS
ncbi:MAG: hypothetical protein LIP02_03795 [Bacteroidales bacterium]|nr:hypothetical protein [Bacteroidales bacterium]